MAIVDGRHSAIRFAAEKGRTKFLADWAEFLGHFNYTTPNLNEGWDINFR